MILVELLQLSQHLGIHFSELLNIKAHKWNFKANLQIQIIYFKELNFIII